MPRCRDNYQRREKRAKRNKLGRRAAYGRWSVQWNSLASVIPVTIAQCIIDGLQKEWK